MQKVKDSDCKISACCTTHRCEILGVVFLAIATILTLITFSGAGILGMFIVGVVFCCHKHLGCRCNCCSPNAVACTTSIPKQETAVAAKKIAKK